MLQPKKKLVVDRLTVNIYETKEDMGLAAAQRAAEIAAAVAESKAALNVLFSTGASQFPLVAGLQRLAAMDSAVQEQDVQGRDMPWKQIQGFHLDEYLGMDDQHPASFRLWLRERIEEPFGPALFHYIAGDAADAEAECQRYSRLLEENSMELGFIGVGENGHIAFNDPPVANFADPQLVKVVELDEACRRQQLGEGWFPTLEDVPTHALTLTVPAIMACRTIISVIPDARKAAAVKRALQGPITEECPASILREHPSAEWFLDADSAGQLEV